MTLAGEINMVVRGWINYYGRFYRSAWEPCIGTRRSLIRRRTVRIPAFLRAPLAEFIAGRDRDQPLFTSAKGKLLRNSNFRHYAFNPAVVRAGLAPLTPHDLRDTAASLAVASGANVKAVQRMLGHASAAVTLDIYAGLFDADLDDVSDRMNGAAHDTFGEWTMKRSDRDDARRTSDGDARPS